jgi:hypothetical protein
MRTSFKLAYSACVVMLTVSPTSAVLGQGRQGRQVQTPGQGQGRGAQAAPVPPKPRPGHPSGKLVLWGDTALFVGAGQPENCFVTNRFKHGQRIGFRMAAMDGGTAEPENTAMLTIHLKVGGNTIDIPMRFRGSPDPSASPPQPNGYLQPITNLWTAWWQVPDAAPIGMMSYTVTATDQFGRTATFEPFSYNTSQLTIVE